MSDFHPRTVSARQERERKENGEAKGFFGYWRVYFGKFWDLIILNLLFLGCMLPFFVASFFMFQNILPRFGTTWFYVVVLLSLAPFALCGPFLGAMTLVTRDFTRGIPVFLWKDYWSAVKNNWKQCITLSVIGYLLFALILNACILYRANFEVGVMQKIFFYVSLTLFAVFLFAQLYLYMMSVTLKLNIRQILKNAVYFSFLGLWRNLLAIAAMAIFTAIGLMLLWFAAVYHGVLYPLFFFYFGFLYFSLCGHTISYLVFPMVRKYVIDPYYAAHPEETAASVVKDDGLDFAVENPKASMSEYVYENGRMVQRSVLENVRRFEEESDQPKANDQ